MQDVVTVTTHTCLLVRSNRLPPLSTWTPKKLEMNLQTAAIATDDTIVIGPIVSMSPNTKSQDPLQ